MPKASRTRISPVLDDHLDEGDKGDKGEKGRTGRNGKATNVGNPSRQLPKRRQHAASAAAETKRPPYRTIADKS